MTLILKEKMKVNKSRINMLFSIVLKMLSILTIHKVEEMELAILKWKVIVFKFIEYFLNYFYT